MSNSGSASAVRAMVSRPTAAIGFNTNLPYRDGVFHVQTEDSGPLHCHIDTHLFGKNGGILRSLRFDYSAYRERDRLTELVTRAMRAQHRAMVQLVTSGQLDVLLFPDGATPAPRSEVRPSLRPLPPLGAEEASSVEPAAAVRPDEGIPRPPRVPSFAQPAKPPTPSPSTRPPPTARGWDAAVAAVRAVWEDQETAPPVSNPSVVPSSRWDAAVNTARRAWATEGLKNSKPPGPISSAPPRELDATGHYEASVRQHRAGDRRGALAHGAMAVHLEPENRRFRALLRRLLDHWDRDD